MNKLVKTLAVGGGMVVIYIAGKVSSGLEFTRAVDEALKEHDLKIKDATMEVPLLKPLISHTKVTLEKLNKEERKSQ